MPKGKTKQRRKNRAKSPLLHTCPLFSVQFEVYERWPHAEFKAAVQAKHGLGLPGRNSGGSTTFCESSTGPLVIIWTRAGYASDAALMHELIHATNMVLLHVGVYASQKHDEITCYYTDYLHRIVKGRA